MLVFDEATIAARRERAAAALGDDAPTVLIAAGGPISIPGGLDQTYPFRPHPAYYWLTGSRRSGGVLVFDRREGWTHFVRPVDAQERLWEADVASPEGRDVAQLGEWLERRSVDAAAVLGAPMAHVANNAELSATFGARLDAARRPKDAAELEIFKRACRATAEGFARAREFLRPGVTERAVQIELEAEMFRQGADSMGYETIVGAGPHAAVLHFMPGERKIAPDDLVLIDAGGAMLGYTADVTRTLPAGERFTAEQQAIYDIVLAAETAAIANCRDGVEWHDVHRTAAEELATGLRHVGILRASTAEAIESGAIALFLPHGIGHLVGLGVRDVGGRAAGREEGRMCCGARVRVDLPLRQGFLMTVEPGVYFVPAILDDPRRREQYATAVAWDELERWRGVGGVRIEDDVLVTAAEPEVLTREIAK